MFSRKSLDLVILSIVRENATGISSYGILTEVKARFGSFKTPSPGTIYPKLAKLEEAREISKTGDLWTITRKGREKLEESVPDFLEKSMEMLPHLINTLANKLPFITQLGFYPEMMRFSDRCGSNCRVFDKERMMKNIDKIPPRHSSISDLHDVKEKMERLRGRLKGEIDSLDSILAHIDEKIMACKEEKKTWTRIPIEDGDSNGEL
ncbi:MAG: PadR family transcriptional regulator [Promethearchaeota archaeon]